MLLPLGAKALPQTHSDIVQIPKNQQKNQWSTRLLQDSDVDGYYVTVSVGKGFGSNGKQHHKHTASETQSHNK